MLSRIIKFKMSKGVKASIAFFLSSVITAGISYIVTPIYTRMLNSDEFGKTSVFMTWLQIFGIVAMFCLSYGVFNNGMSDYKDKRDEYSFSMLILSNIITVVFFGILLCIYPLISQYLRLDIALLLIMFVVCLFQPAYNFWAQRQRYEYKYKMLLIWSITCAILSPLVAILAMISTKEGERLYPRIFGAECALACIYICFYIYLGHKCKWKIKTNYWKGAFLFNLPLIPHYLSIYLLGSSDKIMISYLINDSATAYYSIAHSIATIAMILWNAINASLIPYTYEMCEKKDFKSINKITLPLITFFAVGCIGVIMFAPEAVKIMATSEYLEAIYVIPPIVGGVFFQAQYFIYANVIYYHKKPIYVMVGSITAFVMNIVLNYFCIKRWGYIAAGYTTIFCYGIQALIDFFAMKKVVKANVYNMKYIILLSFGVIMSSCLSVFIYDSMRARFAIVAMILILIIIFRKKITKILFGFKKQKEAI